MRAIYAIMGCYKRYKVKAHFWEVERRFANVRTMADYGKSVQWPTPPAALSQFHNNTVMLHRRSDPILTHSYNIKITNSQNIVKYLVLNLILLCTHCL